MTVFPFSKPLRFCAAEYYCKDAARPSRYVHAPGDGGAARGLAPVAAVG
jgi:hypothetical protein